MTSYIVLFLAAYCFIFLKAWQQRNVACATYRWILPTSYAIAMVEIYVIANVARAGWSWMLVLCLGTGAGLGAISAVWIHCRYISKGKKT